MVDLKNKLENNLESEKNFNTDDNSSFQEQHNSHTLKQNIDSFSESITDKSNSIDIVPNSNNALEELVSLNESTEVSNCLALTVKKDYNLTIVKNVFLHTLKNTWRIALSIFTLNILKFFL